jgi:hypothetical protein
MIKTLRITSVVAAILAGIFFVFPVVYGVRSNGRVDEFLKQQSVREKFENAADNKAKTSESRTSPLVEQAEAFALYLNPDKPAVRRTSKGIKTTNISSKLAVTPKFKVFATSYYAENPELSQALIDEPGRGRYWVRQSGKVGHLLVEQVKDGLVIIKGGEETFELTIEQKPGTASPKTSPTSALQHSRSHLTSRVPPSGRSVATSFRRTSNKPQKPQINSDDEKMDQLVDKLKDLQRNAASDKTKSGLDKEERAARIQELIAKFKSTRVSAEESKKLGNMGEELKGSKPPVEDEKEDEDTEQADSSKSDSPPEK